MCPPTPWTCQMREEETRLPSTPQSRPSRGHQRGGRGPSRSRSSRPAFCPAAISFRHCCSLFRLALLTKNDSKPPLFPCSDRVVLLSHVDLHDLQRVAVSGRGPGRRHRLLHVRLEEDRGGGCGRRALSLRLGRVSQSGPPRT